LLPKDGIIVNEGANTLDIGRLIIQNELPRSRLDSGVLGTMGVGNGYAIAAALVNPNRKVVTLQGDSAFGFSGMEIEVACRYNLPITFIILNNNGIYSGIEKLTDVNDIPSTAFLPDVHYEKIMEAFGGKGYYISKAEEVESVLKEAIECKMPALVNVVIDPKGPIPSNVAQHNQKSDK